MMDRVEKRKEIERVGEREGGRERERETELPEIVAKKPMSTLLT